jgi:nicotinate-nucleotide--dimethylbenzimidazole phosphoribosyltransferase
MSVPPFICPTVQTTANPDLVAEVQSAWDLKTKPQGALGDLESLVLRLALMQGHVRPRLVQPQLLVFAADHGLAAQGVSAYPAAVTAQMVLNMLAGGAAVSVLARAAGLDLKVVDCGVAADLPAHPQLLNCKLGPGTADASQGPAMSMAQCHQALHQGAALLKGLPGNALLLGEMGIGNTSAASLLMARLSGLPLAHCVGRGTGLNAAQLAHKLNVLQAVAQRHAQAQEPLDVLAAMGGFEIATMCGAICQAAHERRLIVVDGFITGSALMVAAALQPAVLEYCLFSHQGAEAGHAAMLRELKASPLLRLGLRLGEGSGAALAWPIITQALRLYDEMASFASAGVSGRGVDA